MIGTTARARRLAPRERARGGPLALAAVGGAAAVVLGLGLSSSLGTLPSRVEQILPAGAVLLAAVVLLAFARPGLVLVAGFVLLAYVRAEPAPVDVVFAVLVLASVVWRRHRLVLPPAVSLALVAFALLTMLSMVNAEDGARAARFEVITLYLLVLAAWLTGALADASLARRAVKAYVLVAAASALAGTVALHVSFPGSSTLLYDPERAMALFKDPNVFGPFLVPASMIVLEDLARPRLLGWSARTKLAVLAVLLAGVVFAFSRAGWLNFGVAATTVVLVYAWRRRGLAAALKAALALAGALLAGLGLLVATGSLSFFESRSNFQTYDQARFGTQASAFEQATAHVLGYGPGQSETALVQSAHSIYARAAFEQGVAGLLALLLVLGATLWCAAALAARDEDVHGIGSAALLASWLGLLANGYFVDTLHWRHLWIVAALIWLGYAKRSGTGSPDPLAAPSRRRAEGAQLSLGPGRRARRRAR